MPAARRRPSRPSELPSSRETWGCLTAQLRLWITPEGAPAYRPWVTLVLDLTHDRLMASELYPQAPETEAAEELLAGAMLEPGRGAGKPRRPAELIFADPALAEALAPALARVEVAGGVRPLPELEAAVRELETHLRGGQPELPGLLATPGVTPALAGGVFAAAAEFYQAAPWVALADAQALAVRVPAESEPARIVSVMGNGGLQYGLAVYERFSDFEKVLLGGGDLRDLIGPRGNLALWFEPAPAVPFADLEAFEAHGWRVAAEQAYPLPVRVRPEIGLQRPGPDDLRWLEAALVAIARGARARLQADGRGDYAPFDLTLTVPTQAGPVPVRLTYPAGHVDLRQRSMVTPEWDAEEPDPAGRERRRMEGTLAELGAALGVAGGSADPRLRQAQQLMYQAWETEHPARRLALAHEALALSADCADAYVLLAEDEADTAERALTLYGQGVAAGERALGPAYFQENAGRFWGLLETRPYMRARIGLANTLWLVDRRAEAVGHYRELLRLNPGDNQGARYALLNLLLENGDDDGARALLSQYDDGLAEWQYTRALLEFKRGGAGPAAQRHARSALAANAQVPAYLAGRQRLPSQLPARMGVGDDSEAQHYAARYLSVWRRVPGAVEWLAGLAAQAPAKPRRRRSGRAQG